MGDAGRKSWWDQNWYWAVPSGCLGCLGLIVTSCAVIVGGVFGSIRGSEPFEEVLSRARADPRVIEALGEPIKLGWSLSGKFSTGGRSGMADLTVPISGPNGAGLLHVSAYRENDEWIYEVMTVRIEKTNVTIDLLSAPSMPDPATQSKFYRPGPIILTEAFYVPTTRLGLHFIYRDDAGTGPKGLHRLRQGCEVRFI